MPSRAHYRVPCATSSSPLIRTEPRSARTCAKDHDDCRRRDGPGPGSPASSLQCAAKVAEGVEDGYTKVTTRETVHEPDSDRCIVTARCSRETRERSC